jgi:hypothetical protein
MTRTVSHPFDLISAVDHNFHLNSQDTFVISGGEPTLTADFFQIVSFLSVKIRSVIVYTNGRLLQKDGVGQALQIGNVRWIIPFYGLQAVHTKLCGDERAFYETYNNLLSLKEITRKKIDVKILLNNDISENEILRLVSVFQDFACLHISCLNNRKRNDIENRRVITKRLNKCILSLFLTCSVIKFSNIPLCELEEKRKFEFAEMIDNNLSESIREYYFIDVARTKKINYNRQHQWLEKCVFCTLRSICVDTNRHFRVAMHKKSKIWLNEE